MPLPEERATEDFASGKLTMNACKSYYWIKEFPPVNTPSDELMKRAIDK